MTNLPIDRAAAELCLAIDDLGEVLLEVLLVVGGELQPDALAAETEGDNRDVIGI